MSSQEYVQLMKL